MLNRVCDGAAAVALDHRHESSLDHHQHCDHFADALAREILEIALLTDADNVILHILREVVVVIVIQHRDESTCAVVDGLWRGENFLSCRFHAFNSSAELAGCACHPAVIAIMNERRELEHVAKDDRLDR